MSQRKRIIMTDKTLPEDWEETTYNQATIKVSNQALKMSCEHLLPHGLHGEAWRF